jgi:ribosomal protein S18 acetylase RimI-like enzyme
VEEVFQRRVCRKTTVEQAGGLPFMKIEVTSSPSENDEAFIAAQTRTYNSAFMPTGVIPLCVFARDTAGNIIGGLTGKTYWDYLEIAFLWVQEQHRGLGHAKALMLAAEEEARHRGCGNVLLDTFSFQAPGFYRKLGYREFGRLSGYTGDHQRHYLHKSLGHAQRNDER